MKNHRGIQQNMHPSWELKTKSVAHPVKLAGSRIAYGAELVGLDGAELVNQRAGGQAGAHSSILPRMVQPRMVVNPP